MSLPIDKGRLQRTVLRHRNTLIDFFALLMLLALAVILSLFASAGTRGSHDGNAGTYVTARVEKVLSGSLSPDQDYPRRMLGSQQLQVRILQGTYRGKVLVIANYLNVLHQIVAKPGMTLVVQLTHGGNGALSAAVYNYDRRGALFVFFAVTVLLLCVLGGRKGARALLGTVFTMLCVGFILLPAFLRGVQPAPAAAVVVLLTTAVGFLLLGGASRKTAAAFLATAAGVLCAGVSAWLAGEGARLGGFQMQEAEALMLQASHGNIRIDGMLVAGILIAAQGAVMDLAISVASSVEELFGADPRPGQRALFRAGLRIARDAMGTMVNTLALAFAGASLGTLLLLYSYDIPLMQLLNTDFVGVELMEGLAGSIGIVCTGPVAALLSARFACRGQAAARTPN